jgi:tape measure domain-containing protein
VVVREFINLIGFKVNEQQLKQSERSVQKVANKMQSIGTRMTAFFTLPFAALSVGIAKTISEFEQLDVAFQTIIGDTDKANKLLDELLTLAAKTPFGVTEITKNAKQLLAVGIEYDKIIDTLIDLGNVSAGLSVPLERIALNFGQIKTQGKLTGRELRDFNVAGVPLVAQLAKQFNITEKEVAKLVSSGKVGFSDVEKAFRSMARTGGKFANLMIKQSATLGGLWSNFKDLLVLSARSMSGILLPIFKRVVLLFIELVAIFEKLNPKIKASLLLFGALLAIVGPLILGITVLSKLFTVLALKVAFITAPLLAAIVLIGLLIDDFLVFVKNGNSLLGDFLPPWKELKVTISNFFKITKILFADFISGLKLIGFGISTIFKGLKLDDNKVIEKGAKRIGEGLFMVIQSTLAIVFDLIKKFVPLLLKLVPLFTEFGIVVGKGIAKGIWQGIKDGLSGIGSGLLKFLLPEVSDLLERRKKGEKGSGGLPGVLNNLFPEVDAFLRNRTPLTSTNNLGIAGAGGANKGTSVSATIHNEIVVPKGTTESQGNSIKQQVDKAMGNSIKQLQLLGGR